MITNHQVTEQHKSNLFFLSLIFFCLLYLAILIFNGSNAWCVGIVYQCKLIFVYLGLEVIIMSASSPMFSSFFKPFMN